MSDNGYKKDFGMADKGREATGLYKLGFEPESFKGLMLPFAFVIVVGGILGFVITQL